MLCFLHQRVPAIALCRFCHKGLCPDCSSYKPRHGHYCSVLCFEQLQKLDQLNDQVIEIYARNRPSFLRVGQSQKLMAFILFCIGVFLIAATWHEPILSLWHAPGAILMLFGIGFWRLNRQ